jgi:hypothetical protein
MALVGSDKRAIARRGRHQNPSKELEAGHKSGRDGEHGPGGHAPRNAALSHIADCHPALMVLGAMRSVIPETRRKSDASHHEDRDSTRKDPRFESAGLFRPSRSPHKRSAMRDPLSRVSLRSPGLRFTLSPPPEPPAPKTALAISNAVMLRPRVSRSWRAPLSWFRAAVA